MLKEPAYALRRRYRGKLDLRAPAQEEPAAKRRLGAHRSEPEPPPPGTGSNAGTTDSKPFGGRDSQIKAAWAREGGAMVHHEQVVRQYGQTGVRQGGQGRALAGSVVAEEGPGARSGDDRTRVKLLASEPVGEDGGNGCEVGVCQLGTVRRRAGEEYGGAPPPIEQEPAAISQGEAGAIVPHARRGARGGCGCVSQLDAHRRPLCIRWGHARVREVNAQKLEPVGSRW